MRLIMASDVPQSIESSPLHSIAEPRQVLDEGDKKGRQLTSRKGVAGECRRR